MMRLLIFIILFGCSSPTPEKPIEYDPTLTSVLGVNYQIKEFGGCEFVFGTGYFSPVHHPNCKYCRIRKKAGI